jgi:hypothetical protein
LKDLHYGLAGFIESAVIELAVDLPRSINTVTMHFPPRQVAIGGLTKVPFLDDLKERGFDPGWTCPEKGVNKKVVRSDSI